MKLPLNWLIEYVDIKGLSREALAAKLTMAGLEVTAMEGGVFEIEVTTNRPDWLSIKGLAREVAAITGRELKKRVQGSAGEVSLRRSGATEAISKKRLLRPLGARNDVCKTSPQTLFTVRKTKDLEVSIKIYDKKGCRLYTGRVIRGIAVSASPKWLIERLKEMGTNSVNNVVDITNLCLFESAQPLHAFDLDKLKGAITVRRAKNGEEIVTIDGTKRILDSDILVIADTQGPVAIAGIMGGKATEVTSSTKNILLESAYFDPATVRKASKSLKLSSESSYRFERSVDPDGVSRTSERAAEFISQLCRPGSVGSLYTCGGVKVGSGASLSVRPSKINQILGTEISVSEMKKIVASLGFSVKLKTGGRLDIKAPSFRRDVTKEEDVAEEVARIYGYDRIPTSVPRADIRYKAPASLRGKTPYSYKAVRDAASSCGLYEVVTYGLVGERFLKDAGIAVDDSSGIVSVQNPLSAEQAFLRPSILPSVLSVLARNISRRVTDVGIFELGKIYRVKDGRPYEETALAAAITGLCRGDWQSKARPFTYFDIKGIAELILGSLGITEFEFSKAGAGASYDGHSSVISVKNEEVGRLGRINGDIVERLDIKQETFVLELTLGKLIKYASCDKRYVPLPKFQAVKRDLAVVVKDTVSSEDIVNIIRSSAGGILKDVRLFDLYEGKQIPKGRRSLAYSLEYLDEEKTLTEKDINESHQRVVSALEERFAAEIRR